MKIQGTGTIYKNQYGFSISDNQKQSDGTYNNFYIPVRFKKGLSEPNDRDYVSIEGFTKPFKYKDDKLGMSYFVMDWQLISKQKTEAVKPSDFENKTNSEIVADVMTKEDPYADFGEQISIDDNFLD